MASTSVAGVNAMVNPAPSSVADTSAPHVPLSAAVGPAPIVMSQDSTQTPRARSESVTEFVALKAEEVGDVIVHTAVTAGEALYKQLDRAGDYVANDVAPVIDRGASHVRDGIDRTVAAVRVKSVELVQVAGHKAQAATDTVSTVASDTKDVIVHTAISAKDHLGEAAEMARLAAIRAKDQVVHVAYGVGGAIASTVNDALSTHDDALAVSADEEETPLLDRGGKRARTDVDERVAGVSVSTAPVIVAAPASGVGLSAASSADGAGVMGPKVLDGSTQGLPRNVLAQGP